MRLPRLACFAASFCLAGELLADAFDDRVDALFRPLLGEAMALSPDGQRVAYTSRQSGRLSVVMMNVEPPGPKRALDVDYNVDATTVAPAAPAALRFLAWATPFRLLYAPVEQVLPLPPIQTTDGRTISNPDGPEVLAPILVTDADGRQRGTLIDARQFMETPAEARRTLADLLRTTHELVAVSEGPVHWRMPHLDILGFLPRDREQLIVQTRGAYSMPMQHLVDVRTGSVREFGGDWPVPPGEPHVFDGYRLKVVGERQAAMQPATLWRDEEFAAVQRQLELKFPRRIVEILDWNETRARVLFQVTGGADPGRIFVYQRNEDLVLEILKRAPWLANSGLHPTRFFTCAAPDGAALSGYMTRPAGSTGTPPPLLLMLPSGFPGHVQPAFDPEAQVFADLGFMVVRLNHRAVAGVRAQDLDALRTAVDRLTVDDARAVLAWIAASHPEPAFDRGRVATFGRGFGGYVALRALQLDPAAFHCAVAIDAPMELRSWLKNPGASSGSPSDRRRHDIPRAILDHAGTDWNRFSVIEQAQALNRPALLLAERGRNPAIEASTVALRSKAVSLGRPLVALELDAGFAAGRPGVRAGVYRQIHDFLRRHLGAPSVAMDGTEADR